MSDFRVCLECGAEGGHKAWCSEAKPAPPMPEVKPPQPEGFDFRVARLNLRPGDVLVVKVPRHISEDEAHYLRMHLTEELGERPIIVLTGGIDLAVLRESTGNKG